MPFPRDSDLMRWGPGMGIFLKLPCDWKAGPGQQPAHSGSADPAPKRIYLLRGRRGVGGLLGGERQVLGPL